MLSVRTGAVVSAFLGYRLHEWWVPAAVAVRGGRRCRLVMFQIAARRPQLGGLSAQLLGTAHESGHVLCHVRHRPLGRPALKDRRKGVR